MSLRDTQNLNKDEMYICFPLPDIDYTVNPVTVCLAVIGFMVSVWIALHVSHKSLRNKAYYDFCAAFLPAIVRCEQIDHYAKKMLLPNR